tara:strand:- start:186 stop:1373 length:1188 start_codon:yes stop_codon:yes gene_type:complete
MAKQYYGISALTSTTETPQPPKVNNSVEITSVRIKDIILNDTHPQFSNYGEWNGLGTIFYDAVSFPFGVDSVNIAIPLYSNQKLYPLINEVVPLIFLTSWDAQSNTNITQAYYLPPINIWNSQHHNAIPDPTQQPKEESQSDYDNAIDGSSRDVRRVYDEDTDINLGKGFNEQITTHPLLFFAGDNLIEGRWGNSLRLGSTIENEINSPITIIRNGQPSTTPPEGWVPIVENINEDKSDIYLTENQKIDIEVASKTYNSYTTPPVAPQLYIENQIILNSGRLLLNSKSSDILLSSNQSINFNSVNSVNIDTGDFIVSGGTYLGSPSATEPILKGDALITQLDSLISYLTQFFTIYSNEPPNAKVASTPLAKSIVTSLNGIKANLPLTKSKINFTK